MSERVADAEPSSSSRAIAPDAGSSSRSVLPEPGSSRSVLPEPGSSGAFPPEFDSSTFAAAEPISSSSPDKGAAPPAAPLLIDVTPLHLGVETAGGYCDALIEANTPIPCDRTRTFTTAGDGQTSVLIRVAQGGSMHFSENAYLGEVELRGLELAPRGEVKIRVTFALDESGILSVRAKDSKTGAVTETEIRLIAARTNDVDRATMRARQDFMVIR